MKSIDILNPYNQKRIRTVALQSEGQVKEAINKADSLFNDSSAQLTKPMRIEILENVQRIMHSQIEELTLLAAEEGGKPYVDSKVEVLRAINGVQLAIEHISQLEDQNIPMGHTDSSKNRLAISIREPIGVVTAISAFNHPLNLIVHQVIPALAVGCPVVVKPDLRTPLSCLALADILSQAGLPENWCQVVVCERDAAGLLVTDPRVQFFSFIGSPQVGWMLRSQLAPGTRCALEHGGAAPAIIAEDADIASLIPSLSKGAFYHAGQVCVSVQRIYAHSSKCEELAQQLAQHADKLKVGDPLDPKTEVGPLILPREIERIDTWVQQAIQAGAKLITGGKKLSETCYQPTVLLNPPDSAEVSKHEVFGPVVCVYSYDNREQAIDRANALDFAFQASVFTNNLDVALDTAKKLDATAVMVNDHTAFRVDWMPFGGRKQSGLGMGGIPYSMHELTQTKMIVLNSKAL